MQIYLESVLARDENAKEVKLFGLGPRFLDRYREIFTRLYKEDRDLTVRRDSWGFGLGLLGTGALYGGYAWIAGETVLGAMTVGQMTMYLMLLRQGQSAVSAALTAVSLSIPLIEGRLALGTWQGVYLYEHRRRGHDREVVLHAVGE